jgi:hypothetical protein
MKSTLFVQANVAVNTKLTSKVPFLFGNFQVFKKNMVKNVQFRYGMTGKFLLTTPPPPPPVIGHSMLYKPDSMMALEEIAPIKNQYIPTNFVVVESFGNINE